ncbi:unnamed protein product [Ectocarpus sp. CCAP 1310/34]|nr:unnamed protein product [Ectocarpus sp. CCAP 1310/34]
MDTLRAKPQKRLLAVSDVKLLRQVTQQ